MDADELARWFENTKTVLETAYVQHPDSEPWRQSGMSGPEDRWTRLRKPVADCIDRPGSFLDIGCANGYLLECVVRWAAERGLPVEPWGLDISERLAELARERLARNVNPRYADHVFTGNSFYWQPPRRFDFVRTELVYVPGEYEREYVLRLLERVVAPDGRLLVAKYGEGHPDPGRGLLPGSHPTRFLADRLAELRLKPLKFCDGYDPLRDRRVRVAVLSAESVLD